MSKTISESAAEAGKAAAAQAKLMGASADEQAAAAGRASAAYTDAQVKITRAQKAAGAAAAEAAKAMGASADEQVAASERAVAAQKAVEDASLQAAGVAEATGARIGTAFEDGAGRAGSALTKLGSMGASWGIPFAMSLQKIGTQFDGAATKGEKFAATMAGLGKMTLGVGLVGGLAAGYEGVKGAARLEEQTLRYHTQAGASLPQSHELEKGVLNMAPEVGQSPQVLAESMYHVVSVMNKMSPAVKSTSNELKVLKIASEGADVGGANLVEVQNALDAAIAAKLKGIGNYSAAMGQLNKIVGSGDMTMEDLAEAFKNGLASLAPFGVSLKDIGGALATFGDNNIRGAKAATLLESTVRIMAAPSNTAAEYLRTVGLSATELGQDIRSKGLISALEDLEWHLKSSGATASQQARILTQSFGSRQAKGVEVLISQMGRLKASTREVGQSGSEMPKSYEEWLHTLPGEMHQLEATIEQLADKFGMYLIPKLEGVGHAVGDVIGWFDENKGAAETLAHVIEGVLGLAVLVFAEQKAVAFGKGVSNMVGDLHKLGGAITGTTGTMEAQYAAQAEASNAATEKITADSAAAAEAAQAEAAKMQMSFGEIDSGFATAATASETAEGQMQMSFAGMATAAGAAEGEIAGSLGTEEATVATVDGSIEAENAAAGASFKAMLGPIGAVMAALAVAQPFIKEVTGGDLTESTSKEKEFLDKSNTAVSSRTNTKQYALRRELEEHGLRPDAAAGIVGNIGQESTYDTEAGYMGVGGHYGLMQWDQEGQAGLRAYAKKHLESPALPEVQIGYLMQELHGPDASVLAAIQKAKNPQAAARIFEEQFERAGKAEANIPRRESMAAEALRASPHARHTDLKSAEQKGAQEALEALGHTGHSKHYIEEESEAEKEQKKKVAASLGIPVGVATMLKTAQALVGTGYTSGGGHAGWDPVAALKQIGVDCSGFVSQVLHSGGSPLSNPLTTEGLAQTNALTKGHGKYVTVFDRANAGENSHALIDVLGHYYESGGNPEYNPRGGVTALTKAQAEGELSGGGFVAYRPTGQLNRAELHRKGVTEAELLKQTGADTTLELAERHEAEVKSLRAKGGALLKTLQSDMQTGTARTLEKETGATSKNMTGRGSEVRAQFQELVDALRGTHEKGLDKLTEELVHAHYNALQTLNADLSAAASEAHARGLTLDATELKDRTAIAEQQAVKEVEVAKDMADRVTDELGNAATALKDAGQSISDTFSAQATLIKDQTNEMNIAAQAAVQQVTDKSQTEVDRLAERGLYGLELVAQQQQVGLDESKTGYDAQIAQSEAAVAKAQTETDNTSAAVQAYIDAVTGQQDTIVGAAKTALAGTEETQHQAVLEAKSHLAEVSATTDKAVQQASNAEEKAATGSKAQQETAASNLKYAEAQQKMQVAQAEAAVKAAETAANATIQGAQSTLSQAEGHASVAEQEAQNALSTAQGNASVVLASAEQTLAEAKNKAALNEAEQKALVEKTREEAQTQFAGSGAVINITGVPLTDSAAIASEVGWALRTQVPA
ncbi:MAG TPA: phage tail tip lysozyme [Solirubrobacteraceae bacterium]